MQLIQVLWYSNDRQISGLNDNYTDVCQAILKILSSIKLSSKFELRKKKLSHEIDFFEVEIEDRIFEDRFLRIA